MSVRGDLARAQRAAPRTRLVGVDAARGVALIGMMAVHLLPGFTEGGDVSLSDQIARGRSSAAFALLAGVALALANGSRKPLAGGRWRAAGAALLVRCACIAALGFALGSFRSGLAIILVYYGLLFALAVPLLRLRAPALAGLAVGVATLVPIGSHLLRSHLEPLRGHSPVFADLADPATLLTELAITGYYPVLAWLAYLAAGLAVGRLDLGETAVARRLLAGGAALAVAAVVTSRLLLRLPQAMVALPRDVGEEPLYGTTPTDTAWWLVVADPHSSTTLDLAHTIGTSLALLGACLLLARALGRWIVPLAWVGSMTLTLYTLHVLAVAGSPEPDRPWLVWSLHVVFALLLAAQWRAVLPRGPLEQLVRWPSQRAAALVERS